MTERKPRALALAVLFALGLTGASRAELSKVPTANSGSTPLGTARKLAPATPAPTPHAPPRKAARSPWDSLVSEASRAGIERARLEWIVSQFQRSGFAPAQGREILLPALEAARSGLPTRSILNKINEGLLKRVPPEAIAAASRARLESVRSARGLLLSTWGPVTSKEGKGLISSLALAGESGLPPQVLLDVLNHGRGKSVGLMKSVIEAGEALQLAGFEPEVSLALMKDCLDRNLRHADVLRVVRFAVDRKRQGQEGHAIREALWGQRGLGPRASGAPTRTPAPAPGAPAPVTPEAGPRAVGP